MFFIWLIHKRIDFELRSNESVIRVRWTVLELHLYVNIVIWYIYLFLFSFLAIFVFPYKQKQITLLQFYFIFVSIFRSPSWRGDCHQIEIRRPRGWCGDWFCQCAHVTATALQLTRTCTLPWLQMVKEILSIWSRRFRRRVCPSVRLSVQYLRYMLCDHLNYLLNLL